MNQVVKLCDDYVLFYTYLLISMKNRVSYVGSTGELVKRLKEHNQGLSPSTKRYLPWKLIYYEACLNEMDARLREKYLKTNQGARLLKRRLKQYFYSLTQSSTT